MNTLLPDAPQTIASIKAFHPLALGFTRPVIKAHGRSRDRAIANACKVAAKAARSDMVRTVERAMACLPAEEPSP